MSSSTTDKNTTTQQDAAASASTATATKTQKVSLTVSTGKNQTLVPLDFVDLAPPVKLSEDKASTAQQQQQVSNVPLPLARTKEELEEISEGLMGGLTLFRNIRFEILQKYIFVVMRPNEFTKDNLEKIFSKKKEEFCICAMYAPQLVDAAVKLGLLPMTIPFAKGLPEFLAPKLHTQRCIIRLPRAVENSANPNFKSTLQLPSGIRKKSKKFAIIFDGGFWDLCCSELVKQHELVHSHSWLNEHLRKTYAAMNIEPQKFETNIHAITIVHAAMVPEIVAAQQSQRSAKTEAEKKAAKEHFDAVAKKAFCAGEIGCSVGTTYTSLTGGFVVSGTGSIQLGALAAVLVKCGYEIWDLGMAMDYKTKNLGGIEVQRKKWIDIACEGATHVPYRRLGSLDGYVVRCDAIINAVEVFKSSIDNVNKEDEAADEKPVSKDGAPAAKAQ